VTQPKRIAADDLVRQIGLADAPVLIDVRTDADFATDPRLIPGSFRQPHDRLSTLRSRLAGRRAVTICAQDEELSESAAALLSEEGVTAHVLEGGIARWSAEARPMLRAGAVRQGGLWVTAESHATDRLACPWLIRRFADPDARFLFLPEGEVAAQAARLGGRVFDLPGADHADTGERCAFDAMLADFGLALPALDRLAGIVRGADRGNPAPAAEAAGIGALAVGLARLCRDPHARIAAAMTVFDALYLWARRDR
jgi:rhodanese-related sulfurtransferase